MSFIPVHLCIHVGVMEKRWRASAEPAGIWTRLLPQSIQYGRSDFSLLCIWSPYGGRLATQTLARKHCCHYLPPVCPARFGIDWIWRLWNSEAGNDAVMVSMETEVGDERQLIRAQLSQLLDGDLKIRTFKNNPLPYFPPPNLCFWRKGSERQWVASSNEWELSLIAFICWLSCKSCK